MWRQRFKIMRSYRICFSFSFWNYLTRKVKVNSFVMYLQHCWKTTKYLQKKIFTAFYFNFFQFYRWSVFYILHVLFSYLQINIFKIFQIFVNDDYPGRMMIKLRFSPCYEWLIVNCTQKWVITSANCKWT